MSELDNFLMKELMEAFYENFYMDKHEGFNYNDIEKELNSIKNKSNKYRDIQDILKRYSENKYSKRRFVYYSEKKILPEAKKTSQNQAEYSDYHVGMFFLIDQMQEIYKLEEITKIVPKFLRVCEYLDFGKLLQYYSDILINNNLYLKEIERLVEANKENDNTSAKSTVKYREDSKKHSEKDIKEIDIINNIIAESESRMRGIQDEEMKEKLMNEIFEVVFAVKYLAYAKYHLSVFEKIMKRE